MPSLIDLRRRIRSVKNTQQITKAMKVVSAAKLRRAQDRVLAARPYAQIIQRMLANVAQAAAEQNARRGDRAAGAPAGEADSAAGGHGRSRPGRSFQLQRDPRWRKSLSRSIATPRSSWN